MPKFVSYLFLGNKYVFCKITIITFITALVSQEPRIISDWMLVAGALSAHSKSLPLLIFVFSPQQLSLQFRLEMAALLVGILNLVILINYSQNLQIYSHLLSVTDIAKFLSHTWDNFCLRNFLQGLQINQFACFT